MCPGMVITTSCAGDVAACQKIEIPPGAREWYMLLKWIAMPRNGDNCGSCAGNVNHIQMSLPW